MRRVVDFNGTLTSMAEDDPRPIGSNAWAIGIARFIDEGTGQPIVEGVRATTDFPHLHARTSGAVGGVYGYPPEAFSLLGSQDYDVDMTVETDLHLPRTVPIPVPHRPDAFSSFATVPLGDVALHRRGTILSGRCLKKANGAPMAGATVSVSKCWLVLPSTAAPTPPETATLVSVWPPLPDTYDDATTSIRKRGVSVLGSLSLARPAAKDDRWITVMDASDLAANGILRFEGAVPDRLEFAIVETVDGKRARLRRPLAFDHRVDATVERVKPTSTGGAKSIIHGALPGDVAVYLSNANGLVSGDTIRIQATGKPDSFHVVGLYQATTDSQGSFVLPPISRVGKVEVMIKDTDLNVYIKNFAIFAATSFNCGDLLL